MQLYIRGMDKVNKVTAFIAAILLAISSVIIIFQVASRYVLHYPLPWSEELARYLIIYVVLLGTAVAVRHQKLIKVDFLVELLPGKKKQFLILLISAISIVFFSILLYMGTNVFLQVSTQTSPSLQIPMSIPYASIPLGALLMMLNSIVVILETISGRN
ncbi:TRAP transporter small permease [Alteribacillus sp. YIM 98480]|uniref:TRAP transporter small permease n=1 Tax=Alteribacillus sp. YIM 98480 TaxID=2606599 RepID=UPI00131CA1A7|nr:TRAP transporter small permease [Alteribacillus sp. YIM 98480]